MNSRGSTELIIILTLFSMPALMAIVTTTMASPLFELFYGRHGRASGELEALDSGRVRIGA